MADKTKKHMLVNHKRSTTLERLEKDNDGLIRFNDLRVSTPAQDFGLVPL